MNIEHFAVGMSIKKMAVLGAGQMGNGITQVAACAGIEVVMIDIHWFKISWTEELRQSRNL